MNSKCIAGLLLAGGVGVAQIASAAAPASAETAASAAPSADAQTQATPAAPAGAASAQTGQSAGSAATPTFDPLSQAPAALMAALDEDSLPKTTSGLIAELSKRAGEVEQMVKGGNLGEVWLPAMGTKTVALVLASQASSLPERQRADIDVAVKRVVTSAWELDQYGDLGNKQKMTEAYQRLASAVADLKGLYGSH